MHLQRLLWFALALLTVTSCGGPNPVSRLDAEPVATPTPSAVATPEVKAQALRSAPAPTNPTPETTPETTPAPVKASERTEKPAIDAPEDRNRRLEIARKLDEDVLVLKNKNRRITVRGMQAWSGKNGSGDLGYESCDIDGKCLTLQGGTVTCSRGTCGMSWNNGDYGYGLTAPMNNPDRPDPNTGYSLTVVQGGKVILEEDGFTTAR
jgi:hypothetical protein